MTPLSPARPPGPDLNEDDDDDDDKPSALLHSIRTDDTQTHLHARNDTFVSSRRRNSRKKIDRVPLVLVPVSRAPFNTYVCSPSSLLLSLSFVSI